MQVKRQRTALLRGVILLCTSNCRDSRRFGLVPEAEVRLCLVLDALKLPVALCCHSRIASAGVGPKRNSPQQKKPCFTYGFRRISKHTSRFLPVRCSPTEKPTKISKLLTVLFETRQISFIHLHEISSFVDPGHPWRNSGCWRQ